MHENFSTYVRILHDTAGRRRLAQELRQTLARVEDLTVPTAQLGGELEKVSAIYRDGVAAERKIRFPTAAELAAETVDEVKWVARPWVVAGGITLAIGKVKSAGKTTLFTHVVKSVLDGLPFMSGTTAKGPVVYLSEQSDATLRVALQRVGLLQREDLRIVTWAEISRVAWPEVVGLAVQECKKIGAVLMVVDTIGQFTGLVGDAENNAGDALRAMAPLQQAAGNGLGILVSQHERKSGGDVEDSGRGSSAFAGAVDIVLNIRRLPGNGNPRLRSVRGLSRFDETPSQLTVELTAEGYVIRDTELMASQQAETSIMTAISSSKAGAMAMDDLCQAAGLKRTSGQQAIDSLVKEGRLTRAGKGRKGDPHRYSTPEILSAGNTSYKGQKEIAGSNGYEGTKVPDQIARSL